ncbi:MAG: hypothetical protein XU15_C0011G0079 [candidate division NC10 bacterium CSP1-5]|nr:MAG: hypothetical protein XU15_C0011G0079 [candidate division NC10 bacterium CSP1-5]
MTDQAEVRAIRTITIEVRGGCVDEVRGLPKGWNYRVIDHDLPEVGECPMGCGPLNNDDTCPVCGWKEDA